MGGVVVIVRVLFYSFCIRCFVVVVGRWFFLVISLVLYQTNLILGEKSSHNQQKRIVGCANQDIKVNDFDLYHFVLQCLMLWLSGVTKHTHTHKNNLFWFDEFCIWHWHQLRSYTPPSTNPPIFFCSHRWICSMPILSSGRKISIDVISVITLSNYSNNSSTALAIHLNDQRKVRQQKNANCLARVYIT